MITDALLLTGKLALITTLVLLVLCLPIASWLANTHSRLKPWFEAFIALPLVLPPTVLGFYLLLLMSPDSLFGGLWREWFDQTLAFSFWGLVFGSVIYSLPFVLQPLQRTFEAQRPEMAETAMTLGMSPLHVFLKIRLPLAMPGLIAASVLGFAHTVGEFGVVLMIGGNIPGQTQVLSILLFDQVESLNYALAHSIAGGLVFSSMLVLFALYRWNASNIVRVG